MVDVSAKDTTTRAAVAHGFVQNCKSGVGEDPQARFAQGKSAGNRANCWDFGGKAYGRVDTSLSSPVPRSH